MSILSSNPFDLLDDTPQPVEVVAEKKPAQTVQSSTQKSMGGKGDGKPRNEYPKRGGLSGQKRKYI